MNDFFGHIPTNYQATMVHKLTANFWLGHM